MPFLRLLTATNNNHSMVGGLNAILKIAYSNHFGKEYEKLDGWIDGLIWMDGWKDLMSKNWF